MTHLTEYPKRHSWIAFLALIYVCLWALWIPRQQLQASTSVPPAAPTADDSGIIAYVKDSTNDIHLISPDGSGDRLLWTAPDMEGLSPAYELAWRPDGRELAFTSGHEQGCSWYDNDIYVIAYNGVGYRRITNSPACDVLAGLPKGAVKFHVSNWVGDSFWVYVQGAPAPKFIPASYDEMVTFDDVADLGPGVLQPTAGISGVYRYPGGQPYADVQPGQTVLGGSVIRTSAGGAAKRGFGVGKISWKPDGSALAYAMQTDTVIRQIPANPSYGSIGADLPIAEKTSPRLVAWGPTPATKDQYLYSSGMDLLKENVGGIYLNTVGNASGGTQLVIIPDYSGQIAHDIEWLPDGSGFLFTLKFVQFPPDLPGTYSDVFEYNFASPGITRLTALRYDSDAGGAEKLSISPDGQYIVFERTTDPDLDATSSLWIMNRDGTNMDKLADDAGRPAWGRTPAPFTFHVYLPLVRR